MLVISSREFRQNQKKYFEKVDSGEQIIVKRGKDKAYSVNSIGADDMYFNTEMIKKIKQSVDEIRKGEFKTISNRQEIKDLLGL